MLCVFFQSTEARGWGQWTQVPLECSLQEGSVACLAGASTARLRSCLHSLFLFGLADLQSSQRGPEPSRTSLSLLERPSSLVNSPLSRYIGLIKGKYFNNTENGHWYSAVGGEKACSKTVCYLILFCKTNTLFKGIEARRGTRSRQYKEICFSIRKSNKFNIESK